MEHLKENNSAATIQSDLSGIRYFHRKSGSKNRLSPNSKLNLPKRATGVKDHSLLDKELGLLSLGLISAGIFSAGLLAVGSIALGLFASGAISVGLISFGALSVGYFSSGALAIGKYIAVGDHAHAMIAIGQTVADGSVYSHIGDLTMADIPKVVEWLDGNVPSWLFWAKEIFKFYIQ